MNSILERIYRTVRIHPGRTAYSAGGTEISYGELWDNASRGADLLKRQGSEPVILYGDREAHMAVSIVACLMAKRTYVPVRCDTPPARLALMARMTGASLMLSERIAAVDGLECVSLEGLERFAGRAPCEQRNDIVYIIFTSGSTGDPKGVPISDYNLENFVEWISGLEPLCRYGEAVVFGQASFSFDLSVADFYYALCGGHTLTAPDGDIVKAPEKVFRALAGADIAVMTPTFARLCLMYDEFRESEGFRLRCIYFCGETLDAKTVRRLFIAFPSVAVINAYGPTEATSAVSAARITRETAYGNDILPAGEAASFATKITVEDGEIVLRGRSVFGGYLDGHPGGYFSENGINCYRTGDMGRIEDGLLYCCGRMDRQIKYNGYRIELDGIERNIGRIDGVRECAVIAVRNSGGAVISLRAFAVTDGGLDAGGIRTGLSRLVPEYMVPKSIRIVDSLPVNENGKTDRKALETW